MVYERNVLLLVEQACGPIDEAIASYRECMDPTHYTKLTQVRDILEEVLTDFENDPNNPDVVHD